MEKRNQEYCKADALAGLAVLVNNGAGHVGDDYGLLESLASDTLSPNEARRFAEHLKTCEECRQECATLWATGLYDDAPFGDRMRAFEKDPISETDEHWKTIAVVFNEELASAAKRSVASFDESVADDLYVAPEFKQALAVWEANKPTARPKAASRRVVAKWHAFAYSAAAVLLGVVVVQFLETKPPVDPGKQIARHTTDEPESESSNATESPALDDVGSENGARSVNSNPEDASAPEPSVPRAATKGFGALQSGAKGSAGAFASNLGVKASSPSTPQHEYVQESDRYFTAFAGAADLHQQGVAAFNAGDFSAASKKFGELVKLLNGNPKFVEGVKGDLNAALFDAYWNYGVATAKNNDKKSAVKIFEDLKAKKLAPDAKQEGFVDAALKAWGGNESFLSFLTEITKTLGVDGRRAFFLGERREKRTVARILRIATARERTSPVKTRATGANLAGRKKR